MCVSEGQLGYENTDYFSDSSNFGKDIDLGTGVTVEDWSAGRDFNCFLTTDYAIKCFGDNSQGQLGIGSTNNVGDESNEMGDNLAELDLGTFTVTQMMVGEKHGCAINDNYEVKCWGDNYFGQLGLGDTNDVGDEAGEMGDNMGTVNLGTDFYAHRIVLGNWFTCVISTDMELKCFGRNNNGQLGQEHTDNIGDDGGEMGDHLDVIDLGTDFSLDDLKCSSGFICATNSHGDLKCWGGNADGQVCCEQSVQQNCGAMLLDFRFLKMFLSRK